MRPFYSLMIATSMVLAQAAHAAPAQLDTALPLVRVSLTPSAPKPGDKVLAFIYMETDFHSPDTVRTVLEAKLDGQRVPLLSNSPTLWVADFEIVTAGNHVFEVTTLVEDASEADRLRSAIIKLNAEIVNFQDAAVAEQDPAKKALILAEIAKKETDRAQLTDQLKATRTTVGVDRFPMGVTGILTDVAAGSYHTCAILSGAVKCWGANMNGELGLGDSNNHGNAPDQMGNNLPYPNLGPGKIVKAVAAGYAHTCALFKDGTVKCWGYNGYGQLGLGDTLGRGVSPEDMGDNLPSVDLGTDKTAKAISAGGFTTCAILNDDSVKCWGANAYGQLGLGDTIDRGAAPGQMGDHLLPVDLGTGKTAKQIAAGTHSCALLNDNSVKCWGRNVYGQLGQGNTSERGSGPDQMGNNLLAIDLGNGKTAKTISSHGDHVCAILNDDTLKCWGWNCNGQLGQGDNVDRGTTSGQMGDSLQPIDLGNTKTAKAVVIGDIQTCAILNDDSVKCWGLGGTLGIGDSADRGRLPGQMGDSLPAVNLGVGKQAKAITTGDRHTCVILNDQTLKCWGWNNRGQLGLGDVNARGDEPGQMGNNLTAVQL